ncbi:MAG: hypothetical protein AAB433_03740, partial [Nitrospirota bacterium]
GDQAENRSYAHSRLPASIGGDRRVLRPRRRHRYGRTRQKIDRMILGCKMTQAARSVQAPGDNGAGVFCYTPAGRPFDPTQGR